MRYLGIVLASAIASVLPVAASAEQYAISDEFDGCEFGKLYELEGGAGILECQAYNYFWAYRPTVVADGRHVTVIGDERVEGYIHDGSVYHTHIDGYFKGCDYNTVYRLDNGWLFQCATFHYSYTLRPDVQIFEIDGRQPVILIHGYEYDGMLLETQ